jgi:hypothetical protein
MEQGCVPGMNVLKLINFIKNNPDDDARIESNLLEFAQSSDPVNLRNFFVQCDKAGFWGDEIAYITINALIKNKRENIVSALYKTAPEKAPHYGIYRIGQALVDFKNFNLDDGCAHLRDGLYHCAKNARHFVSDMDDLARNAFLLENVRAPEAEPYPKPSFEIMRGSPFSESPYTCSVMCGAEYFGRYADAFIKGLRERCGGVNVFVLAVNPDDGMVSRCSAYGGITVARTFHDGRWEREFRAAARFAAAGDVLRAVNGPVIFMDIDRAFEPGCEKILSEFAGNGISVFDTGDMLPSRRIDSSIVGSRPCGESFAFWDAAGDFVLKRLGRKGPLSELGGAALFAAACRAKSAGLSVSDISSAFGGGKTPAVTFPRRDTLDATDALPPVMTDDLYRLKTISSAGRVEFGSVEGLSGVVHPPKKDSSSAMSRRLFNDSAKLFDFLKKNRDAQKKNEAIMNFARGTDVLGLRDFLERCRWEGFNAPLVAYGVVYNLVSGGSDDMVSSLLATANKASPLYGIFNVGQAFVDCKNFEVESCGYHLRECVYHCLRDKVDIPDLGFIMQNAYLMESVAWPSPERYPMPELEIIYEDRFESSPYTLFTFGSPLFFRHYWDKRIKNIREICGDINIFLLLVNPDADSVAKVKSCGGVTIATADCPEGTSEHFGLISIVAGKKHLEIYNQPIIGIELDSIYPPEAKDVFDFMAKCPVIIAETDNLCPALRIDGGAHAFMPCDEAFYFLDLFIDHMREDLTRRSSPIYLFDQMARYRVVAEGRKRGWEMLDINKHTNGGFRRLFKESDMSLSLDERKKTRLNDKYTFAGMSEDRRLIVLEDS